jgi:hypothetical protein
MKHKNKILIGTFDIQTSGSLCASQTLLQIFKDNKNAQKKKQTKQKIQ